MIDERHEELAALYALDLLDGLERVQFETALARDPALQSLVRELRDTSTALAFTAPAVEPPAELQARVFASIDRARAGAAPAGTVIRPPASVFRAVIPWAAAAGFALLAGWYATRYVSVLAEKQVLAETTALAESALKLEHLRRQSNELLAERRMLQLEQDMSAARTEIAGLKSQADVAQLKIATLASMLNNSPQAVAVAVWAPAQNAGVFQAEKLPAPGPDHTYELWAIADGKPVSAGVFPVNAEGGARVTFKTSRPVTAVAAFAVSRERRDGAASHAAPSSEIILMGK